MIDLEPTLEDSRSYMSAVRGILGEENLTVFKENLLEFRNKRLGSRFFFILPLVFTAAIL